MYAANQACPRATVREGLLQRFGYSGRARERTGNGLSQRLTSACGYAGSRLLQRLSSGCAWRCTCKTSSKVVQGKYSSGGASKLTLLWLTSGARILTRPSRVTVRSASTSLAGRTLINSPAASTPPLEPSSLNPLCTPPAAPACMRPFCGCPIALKPSGPSPTLSCPLRGRPSTAPKDPPAQFNHQTFQRFRQPFEVKPSHQSRCQHLLRRGCLNFATLTVRDPAAPSEVFSSLCECQSACVPCRQSLTQVLNRCKRTLATGQSSRW